jgi:hypothetical protein
MTKYIASNHHASIKPVNDLSYGNIQDNGGSATTIIWGMFFFVLAVVAVGLYICLV